jgi:hypothetical protein
MLAGSLHLKPALLDDARLGHLHHNQFGKQPHEFYCGKVVGQRSNHPLVVGFYASALMFVS